MVDVSIGPELVIIIHFWDAAWVSDDLGQKPEAWERSMYACMHLP